MTSKHIAIEPVTRVEGEVRVVVLLDDSGNVRNVYYQTLEFRGFEVFCRGRAVEELPRITSAVCGVCSWAHHLVSGKALDMLYGRKPTETAIKIRELACLAQIVDSHMLHFVVMALPDLILMEMPPEYRNVVGILKSEPKLVKLFLRSRTLIRKIQEILGGKAIHPALVLPGGVAKRLTKEDLENLDKYSNELLDTVSTLVEYFDKVILKTKSFIELLGDEKHTLKSYYMGLVDEENALNFYDGYVRIVDADGREVAKFRPEEYTNYIAEHYEEWAYAAFPYLKTIGWKGFEEGYVVRVGPLARLNVAEKISTDRAAEEFKLMLDTLGPKPIHNTMAYHWARLIESLHACEKMRLMLQDPEILSDDIINLEGTPKFEGVGIVEAPRGILIHHYRSDENFVARDVNIITPTTINNTAINTELRKAFSKLANNGGINEKALDIAEVVIRAYDPCNSCATHCIYPSGRLALRVLICDSSGKVLKELSRASHGR